MHKKKYIDLETPSSERFAKSITVTDPISNLAFQGNNRCNNFFLIFIARFSNLGIKKRNSYSKSSCIRQHYWVSSVSLSDKH